MPVAYDHGDRVLMSIVLFLRDGDAHCLDTANVLLRMISGRTAFELCTLPPAPYHDVGEADQPVRLASEESVPPMWDAQADEGRHRATIRSVRLARIFKARRERRTRAH